MQSLPEYVQVLSGQHIKLTGDDVVIKTRKKGLQEKPPLYMWNLSKSCYVSSIKPTLEKNIFTFDVRQKTGIKLYQLSITQGQISVKEV